MVGSPVTVKVSFAVVLCSNCSCGIALRRCGEVRRSARRELRSLCRY